MAGTKITTDHDEIRKWAEERGGRPATVRATRGPEHGSGHGSGHGPGHGPGHGNDDAGIIRIEFPDAPHSKHDALEEISWEEFFEKFDESNLALLYQEETAGGEKSNFNKLIGRETAEAREHGANRASRHHPHGR
jgi:hypothetical protein